MGVRLYNARRGLFTSKDPVLGGNETAYAYPTNPVDRSDLSGKCGPATAVCVGVFRWLVGSLVRQAKSKGGAKWTELRNAGIRLPTKWLVQWELAPFIVYRIFTIQGNRTFKFGISRVIDFDVVSGRTRYPRPQSQLGACHWQMGRVCTFEVVKVTIGWFPARMWESAYIYNYWKRYGKCPKGNPICM